MSNNCCTFAPEIGKGRIEIFTGSSGAGNAGERPARNKPVKNTYRRRAEEKRGAFTDFGLLAFRFLKYETDLYITLGDYL